LCTSWDSRFDRDELKKLGVVHVMLKPIRQPELLLALLQAVSEDAAPLPRVPQPVLRDPSRSPEAFRTESGAIRLLVAEDNMVNQRVTLLQLQKLGYRADVASTGLEVLEAMERADYDMVLMDCQMPEMDGFEATRRIRQNPRFAMTKVVAMTANAMLGDRERCLASGMDDYISKPTRLNELRDVIVRCAVK
jgi:CheY-like chemotaxis protein